MKRLNTILFIALGIAIGITYCWFVTPLLREKKELRETLRLLQKDNEFLKQENDNLKRKQAEFRENPAYVELTARREGMVRKGEVIYKFED